MSPPGSPRRPLARVLLIGLLLFGAASGARAQADDRRAVEVVTFVDGLQREGRLTDALALLDTALDQLSAGRPMMALLHIRRAETRRALFRLDGMQADLARAEELLDGTTDERLMLCNVHGIRGDAALDQGLLGVAAACFERERQAVEAEVASRGVRVPEWFNANLRSTRLALAREDFAALDERVRGWLADPAYAQRPDAAAQLELRRALALGELDEDAQGGAARAESLLEARWPDLPRHERPRAWLALAELRLRRDDLDGARRWCDRARELLAAPATDDPLERQRDPMLLAVLDARVARLAGAGAEVLDTHAARLDDQCARFRRHWAGRPIRAGGYGPLQYGSLQALLGERIELHLAGGGDVESALGELLAVERLGSLARALEAPEARLEVVRRELLTGPDHGLLVYLPTPWATHLFVGAADGWRHERLARDDEVELARRELVSRLQRGGAGRAGDPGAAASALAALVLPGSVRQDMERWTRLSIVGADLLGELPFELLPWGDDDTRLGDGLAIERWPSLSVALALARSAGEPREGAVQLVVGDGFGRAVRALSPALAPLQADWSAVLAAHPADRRRSFAGPAGSAAALDGGRVWQILAHGVSDRSRELPQALALAPVAGDPTDDGLLWAEDVAQLAAPPLVVLTACRSGASPRRRGDPAAASLAGAFLAAGAQAVVVSPFDLELDAALEVSTALHAALAAGHAPAEALRRARVAVGDVVGGSSLQLVGLGQRPVLPPAPRSRWRDVALPVGALATLVVLLVVRRRR